MQAKQKYSLVFIAIVAILTTLAVSCALPKRMDKLRVLNDDEILKTGWLIGTWQMKLTNKQIFETWTAANDSTLLGKSYFVQSGDSIFMETISIAKRMGQLYYIPTVKNQNGGKAVWFVLTSAKDKQMMFENPAHDFPQKIMYKLVTRDSLLAEISGVINDKWEARQFPMSRLN
jgi:hypothetical protein